VRCTRVRLVVRLTVLGFLALPLAGRAALSDARVLLDHGRVTIHSQSAPLADILTRFAQATGAEVVYEAARPRQLMSVAIDATSPAEAIAQLLEGQGLNYALRLDPTGTKVEMLVVTGSGGPVAAAAGASRGARRSPTTIPDETYEETPAEDDAGPLPDAAEFAEPPAPTDVPMEESLSPGLVPYTGAAPTAPAGVETPPDPGTGTSGAEPGSPRPPSPASYPAGAPVVAPVPTPPVFPGPASYPD
jgi:hypothetical protein